jgi:hypothetical protein
MRVKWSGPSWLKQLFETVASSSWIEAMEITKSLCIEKREECLACSDFLALQARVCLAFRLWDLARFASQWALSVGDFINKELQIWAEEIQRYTCVYDMIARRRFTTCELKRTLESTTDGVLGLDRRLLHEVFNFRCCDKEVKDLLSEHFQRSGTGKIQDELGDLRKKVEFLDDEVWSRQVDAGEIGNESRYANHADNPNGILVNRETHGPGTRHYPHLVALRDIIPGDEITINYGARYWEAAGAGTDPLWLGRSPTEPFADCIYYDGVVEDVSDSPCPGGFLIPRHDEEKRREMNPSLEVKQVPQSHPAYPGFGLYAKAAFSKNQTICVYAGILDDNPYKMRHFSKYAVMVDVDHAIGPFGFLFDSVKLTPLDVQPHLPFLTPFPDVSIPPREGEVKLENQIQHFRCLDTKTTKIVCEAIMIQELRPTVLCKIGQIRKPYDNGKQKDEDEWCRLVQKKFSDIFTKPPPPVPRVRTSPQEPSSETKKPRPDGPLVVRWREDTSPLPKTPSRDSTTTPGKDSESVDLVFTSTSPRPTDQRKDPWSSSKKSTRPSEPEVIELD